MQVTFTNNTSDELYVSTLYKGIAASGSVTTRRTYEQLNAEQELKKLIADGSISITTTPEDGDGAGVGADAVKRTFAFDDADIALAATEAIIPLAGALPGGCVVVGIYADNTDWTDGGVGTFSMDIGNATDDNKFTATPIDIDNGNFVDNRGVYIPADADQLQVKITGSVNLDTLTAGQTELTIYYISASVLDETP